ncbi:hypothetical protein JZ751_015511 [Albula glossodonta]|uniref:Uncharacterized protein n=1 Tax=Albula glossodonta TaxID=121402 RepID=A0A8T2MYE6_9TELE|nr:hypothetical protein JZ751_015511 [Albula glossodonta]
MIHNAKVKKWLGRQRPMARWCLFQPKDAAKMPDSALKLTFYSMSWAYSVYLLFFTQYFFFSDPHPGRWVSYRYGRC